MKKRKIDIYEIAEYDISEIYGYIAQDNKEKADKFFALVHEQFFKLSGFVHLGKEILKNGEEYRCFVFHKNYKIYLLLMMSISSFIEFYRWQETYRFIFFRI